MRKSFELAVFLVLVMVSIAAAGGDWTLYLPGHEFTDTQLITREMPDGYSAEGVTEVADLEDLRSGRVAELEPFDSGNDDAIKIPGDSHDDGRDLARAYMKGTDPVDLDQPVKKSANNLKMAFPYEAVDELPAPWSLGGMEDATWSLEFNGLYSLLLRKGRVWTEPEDGGAPVPRIEERIWIGGDARFILTRREDGEERSFTYQDLSSGDLEPGNFPVGTTMGEIQKNLDNWLLERLSDSLKEVAGT